jgi:hypothetical protein
VMNLRDQIFPLAKPCVFYYGILLLKKVPSCTD